MIPTGFSDDSAQHGAEVVSLTVAAITHLKKVLAKRANSKGVRLGVKKSGCSGLSYVIDCVTVKHEEDLQCSITEGLDIFIDRKSLPFLQGIKIDYVKTGLNAGLKYFNPNETAACGCGESFSVD